MPSMKRVQAFHARNCGKYTMGGSISMLRAEIKAHVKIAHDYPNLLEPHLAVVRFLLELCEEGEGIAAKDRDNPDVLDRLKQVEFDVSTEVELVAENEDAISILLTSVETYSSMIPAPERDTKKRWLGRCRAPEPFPDLYDPVEAVDLDRSRVSLVRMALRCLRMITVIHDVKLFVMDTPAIAALNRVVDANPLDTFIRKDVNAIFKSNRWFATYVEWSVTSVDVYGGDESVKRLENASVAIAVEVMTDFAESDVVQLAAIKRLSWLVGEYADMAKCKADVLAFDVIPAVGAALSTFPETHYDVYAHACRFFTVLVPPKVIGQHGGVEAAIKLLKTCRGFYTTSPNLTSAEEDVIPPSSVRQPRHRWCVDAATEARHEIAASPHAECQSHADCSRVDPGHLE
ncbi:hypothetical protein, variant 15 [Aphanomyces invadans]|uniref:Uncharacterized protein n=1 Tax=Aphanomyces invadans TaxID=157072 RepID=A0A024UL79_9STRA|nr:hypothetical protein, variant 14 [Aphanomyces invadans]XP_008864689.1 hypothetical protein, variant 15 [Aphanomyces invadans]ETW06621.1 hypothetical protein, variant 14 [Aphanomyces invadans]ETW06622.1 hypothetical protein, variant 15 [Aphanomyces invadans]|eukprot:XP_008864688.1 hypothetical protein, variant 14 [Aphanomyces invadans]